MPTYFSFCKKLPDLAFDQKLILNDIDISRAEYRKFKDLLTRYLVLGIDLETLKVQWPIAKLLTTHDASSLDVYIARYGHIHGTRLHAIKTNSCIQTKEKYQAKYGEVNAAERLSKLGASLENYIARYGQEDGIVKWNLYCKKRSETYKSNRGKYAKRNLAWFVEKHGEELGYQIWDKKRRAQGYKVSLAGYIEKYGEEEGRLRCKVAKSKSLEYFVSRYGNDLGTTKYNAYRNKTLPNKFTASKWSLEVIMSCLKIIPDLYYYGINEMVWQLPAKWQTIIGTRCICPDLFYKGRIIEFNGDCIHANPTLFESTDTPHPYRPMWSAKDIWDKDANRIAYYQSKNYQTLTVWEYDYVNNPQRTFEECINFLQS